MKGVVVKRRVAYRAAAERAWFERTRARQARLDHARRVAASRGVQRGAEGAAAGAAEPPAEGVVEGVVERSGARAARRLILATIPVSVVVVAATVAVDADSGWVWVAGPTSAVTAYLGASRSVRALEVPRSSRIAAAVTLGGLATAVALTGDTGLAVAALLVMLAMPQIAWIALLWVGWRDLLRRILNGFLAIFPATFLAVLAASALVGLYGSSPSWFRPSQASEVPGVLLGSVTLEVFQSLVIWACVGPRLVKRKRLKPPVFAVDGYELLTVTEVADGHVLGRLDDGREVRTAVPGAFAEVGSRWLVRVVDADEVRVPVSGLRQTG